MIKHWSMLAELEIFNAAVWPALDDKGKSLGSDDYVASEL